MIKTTAILLITALFINSFGFLFLYFQQINEIKCELKNKIEQSIPLNELTTISVHKNAKQALNLNWKEENEFEYNGKMYDVIKTVEEKDTIKYYCINDEREEALVKSFHNQFDDLNKNKNGTEKGRRILQNLLTQALTGENFIINKVNKKTNIQTPNKLLFYKIIIPKITPPPELLA